MEAIMSWLSIHRLVPTSHAKLRYWLPMGRTLHVCELRKILRRLENSRGSKLRTGSVDLVVISVLRASVMPCCMFQKRCPTVARSKRLLGPLRAGNGIMTVRLEVGGYGSSHTR